MRRRGALLLAGVLTAWSFAYGGSSGPGAPLDPDRFHERRKIPASPPGLTALLLDAAVLSRSPDLADVRIADAKGRQIPYLLELPSRAAARYDLLIEEGDNAPLPLDPPRLLLPAERLRFFYLAGASLELLYGQPGLAPPRYDLELLAPRLLGETAREITLPPERRRSPEPDAEAVGRRIFWGALVGAVLVLLLVLARMLRARPEGPPAS